MTKLHGAYRVRLIAVALFAFAVVLVGRLYFLQVIHADEFIERADHQYIQSNQNLFNRGSIFFEDKEGKLIAAAALKTGFILALDPSKVIDPEAAFALLSGVISLDRETFFKYAGKKDDPYEEIARRVPEAQAKRIESLKIPGVSIYKER